MLTADAADVDEGGTATFTLDTTNVAEGETFDYTLSGVDAADVVGGVLTGTATVDANGQATISVELVEDAITEGAETLSVALDNGEASADIVVNDTSVEPVGEEFTLTSGTDAGADFNGTEGDDTYVAGINTLTSGDSLDGAAGQDRLEAELIGNVGSTVATQNIETLEFDALSGTRTVNMTNMTGVETVEHVGTGNLTLTNVQSADTGFAMQGTSSDLTVTHAAAALTGSDVIDVALEGTTGGDLSVTGAIGAVRLSSEGGAQNMLGSVTAASANTLIVEGGAGFANTTAGGIGTNFSTIDTRNAGEVDLRVAPNANLALLTGATDDTARFTTALQAGQLVDLGDGDNTLELANSTGGAQATLRGVDNIRTTDAAATDIDLTNADQAAAINLAGGSTGVTLAGLLGGSTVAASAALGNGAINVGYRGTVQDESLNLDLQQGGAIAGNDITFTNVKDVTITTGAQFTQAIGGNALKVDVTAGGTDVTEALTLTNTSTGANTFGSIEAATGAANATALTDLTINQTGTGSTDLDAAGAALDQAQALTNYTVNATNGTVNAGTIGNGAASGLLDSVEINAGAAVEQGNIDAANAAGIATVNLNATGGAITGTGGAGTPSVITNTGGNIGTATITGSQDVEANLVTTTSGYVETVNASAHTGALTMTVANQGTGTGSSITLGNAAAGNTNTLTLNGDRDDSVTGGSGADNIIVAGNGDKTLDGGAGSNDSLSFAGNDGKIINASAETQYLQGANAGTATQAQTVAAGKAYDNSGGVVDTSAGADVSTISGFENLTGTGSADIIYASNAGMTITGGAGNDTITLGAGTDTVVLDQVAANNTSDITGFDSGTDTLQVSIATFDAAHTGSPLAGVGVGNTAGAEFTSVANAAALSGSSVAASTDTEVFIHLQDTGAVYFNDDAASPGGLIEIANVGVNSTLTATDFDLIA